MKKFALRKIRDNFAELAYSDSIEKLSKKLLLDIIRDIGAVYPKFNNSNLLRLPVPLSPNLSSNHLTANSSLAHHNSSSSLHNLDGSYFNKEGN